jgi:hypothetical protein
MRKLNGSGSYLKSQTRKNLAKAILSLTVFILALFATGYLVIITRDIGVLQITLFVVSMIPLGAFLFYQRKYYIYKSGSRGEKAVITMLSKSLSDDYYLINEVKLPNSGGDIDHIVMGPSGVFVLETKNWSGKIFANGDQWRRPGRKATGSPSLQVKRNTQKVRQLIENVSALWSIRVWVESVIVFTNQNANFSINNPTVTILKLHQLPSHITKSPNNRLTTEQIQQIAKQFQKA